MGHCKLYHAASALGCPCYPLKNPILGSRVVQRNPPPGNSYMYSKIEYCLGARRSPRPILHNPSWGLVWTPFPASSISPAPRVLSAASSTRFGPRWQRRDRYGRGLPGCRGGSAAPKAVDGVAVPGPVSFRPAVGLVTCLGGDVRLPDEAYPVMVALVIPEA